MSATGTGTHRPTDPLDRQRVAHLEVGHTSVSPGLARAIVAGFLLFVAALPMVEWLGPRGQEDGTRLSAWSLLGDVPDTIGERLRPLEIEGRESSQWARVVTANRDVLAAMSGFEAALEDQSSVGRLLRPYAQLVLSGWLGAGNERVYVGRDGWLFYRPDVEYLTGRGFLDPRQMARRIAGAREIDTAPQPDPRLAIRQFARDLEARGIALVVVPTPVKPSVHPERLAGAYDGGAPLHNASYGAFVEELTRDGILVFDPAAELAGAAREDRRPHYLATDTHWRAETMQQVAGLLARFVETRVALPARPPAGYRTEPREARQTGDTALMLDLPPSQTLYPPEGVVLRYVMGAEGDPWRASRDADVLVLGDSFSNMYSLASMGWGEAAGLVEQFSYALQRPVDRVIQNDQGAHATRGILAREIAAGTDRLAGKRVVVWQFATRELTAGDWRIIALPPPSR